MQVELLWVGKLALVCPGADLEWVRRGGDTCYSNAKNIIILCPTAGYVAPPLGVQMFYIGLYAGA
jgi:hypothetical protein